MPKAPPLQPGFVALGLEVGLSTPNDSEEMTQVSVLKAPNPNGFEIVL